MVFLLPKLFWPTGRKNCSSDQEKLLNSRLKAENLQKRVRKNFEITKGQLISKCLFGIFNSLQKGTKNSILLLWYLKSNCFRLFFGRIEETINWFRELLIFRKDSNLESYLQCLFCPWLFFWNKDWQAIDISDPDCKRGAMPF